MLQESGLGHYQDEKRHAVVYQTESFQIKSEEENSRWTQDIWPQIQALFDTTWPSASGPDNAEFFEAVLQREDSSVILMKNLDGSMLGVSFMYPMQFYSEDQGEFGFLGNSNTAYNSSVIIDPKYRSQGLVLPLLEETLREASTLGYEYLAGRYNASTGHMDDGRYVENGFASRLKGHKWEHGKIVEPTRRSQVTNGLGQTHPVENITFQLNRPQLRVAGLSPLRRSPMPAMAN